ncbi:hypothetical protein XH99_29525 [Bradyrhizobium nanningense]|uniref:Uncharacterized protein n=1 Tax=Bradyrhizobium nanningense TaxID=1325118 RepID=A0A4Q0RXL7_9BRAD|nr:hypothetical protein [Bradyrhizobium nanningense]RXH24204.1 hypothetical protein XH99_29525 [Bradyrhizobium nanningense]
MNAPYDSYTQDKSNQLSLDFGDHLASSVRIALRRKKEAADLLAELAIALGELRAEIDLEKYRASLVNGVE